MQILNSELIVEWVTGAQISYVGSVSAEVSDGGAVQPVSRQSRPLMQATFGTFDIDDVWEMFGSTNFGVKGFMIRPPVDRFKQVTRAPLGFSNGSSQTFQLQISLGSMVWSALYPVASTIVVYDNGTPILSSAWTLGSDGQLTLHAGAISASHAVTVSFEYMTAVRFVDPELQSTVPAKGIQQIQSVTVREII